MAASAWYEFDEAWYAFKANNTQPQYGWGSQSEADRYAARLNAGREVNVYSAHLMSADEVAAHKHIADDGIRLDDALSES